MNLAASCSLRVLGLAVALLVMTAGARGTNRYVTETGATSGSCTSGVISRSTFNSTTLNPGDVVLFCGTIAGEVDPQGNGSSGNPIILRFDTGAKFSVATPRFNQFVYLNGLSYITVDGGTPCGTAASVCNGQIEYTQMGTAWGTVNGVTGISISSANNIEIKNLEIGPLYQHTSASDNNPQNYDSSTTIYGQSVGVNIHIHDNKIHDNAWCMEWNTAQSNQNAQVDHNYIYNCSHGIAYGIPGTGTAGGLIWNNNTIEGPVNWDTTANAFHHDGIHLFCIATVCTVNNVTVYNNIFEGDWGDHNTSAFFAEAHPPNNLLTNIVLFNNVFTNTSPNNGWADGIDVGGQSGNVAYNNTVVCDLNGIALGNANGGLQLSGTGIKAENNVISTCNSSLVGTDGSTGNTFSVLDYNLYANWQTAGGNGAFGYNLNQSTGSTLAAQLARWISLIGGGVEAHSITASSAILNSSGVPQTGSPAINAGQNLTSLCTGNLVLLCSDINGNARPSSGAWTIGAYGTQSTASAPPAPSGLKAVVN